MMANNSDDDDSIPPTLDIKNITWDLSNLCMDHRKAPSSSLRTTTSTTTSRRGRRAFHHLYPSKEDLNASMPDLSPSTVDDLFCAAEKHMNTAYSSHSSSHQRTRKLSSYLEQRQQQQQQQQQLFQNNPKTYDDMPSIEYSSHSQSTSTHYDTTGGGVYTEEGGREETNGGAILEGSCSSFDIVDQTLYETSLRQPTSSSLATTVQGSNVAVAYASTDAAPYYEHAADFYSYKVDPTNHSEADPYYDDESYPYDSKPSPTSNSHHHHHHHQQQQQQHQVEVSPGVFLPLRGTQETLQALQLGDMVWLECFLCQVELCCVPDCEYVLCPDCRILTPVTVTNSNQQQQPDERLSKSLSDLMDNNNNNYYNNCSGGGVGLGLKTSMLTTTNNTTTTATTTTTAHCLPQRY